MIEFLDKIPQWTLNLFTILGTIVSIALSIATIICANNIPKALMKYRIKIDMKDNLDNINGDIKRTLERMNNKNLTKEDFIGLFDSVDAMLFEYSKYMEKEIKIKSQNLHNEYTKMIEKFKDYDTLNKAETVMLLNRYSQMINIIRANTK